MPEGKAFGDRVEVELIGLVELFQWALNQQLAVGRLRPVALLPTLRERERRAAVVVAAARNLTFRCTETVSIYC